MARGDVTPTMSIRQLSYFMALAEHGSISVAASSLNMAQPSLSENIAKLERHLDARLAIRGTRGIQMTEAGMTLLRRGREILQSVDDLVEEIRQIGGAPRGRVSVGLPPTLSILLGVPLVETIYSQHPEIRLHIAEALSGDIMDWVGAGRLDLGCVYDVAESTAHLLEALLTEEVFLATAPDNWPGEIGPDGVALEPVPAARLGELPLVLTSPAHGSRKLQEKFARSVGIRLNVVAEIDSLAHISEMVGRASAYTILSQGAIQKQVEAGTLAVVPIAPAFRRTAYLVGSRARPASRAQAVVRAHIVDILREMVERYRLRAVVHPAAASEKIPDEAKTETTQ